MTNPKMPQVGAPDPEAITSPILDEDEEYPIALDADRGNCVFNGVEFPLGQYVLSGDEVLHCEQGGVWIRTGQAHP